MICRINCLCSVCLNLEHLVGNLQSFWCGYFFDILGDCFIFQDKATEAERTEYMLNILERGSERQFESFRSALRSCNQPVIADDYLRPRSEQQHRAIGRSTSLADPLPGGNVTDPPLPGGNPPSSVPPRSAPIVREDVRTCIFCCDYFKPSLLVVVRKNKAEAHRF